MYGVSTTQIGDKAIDGSNVQGGQFNMKLTLNVGGYESHEKWTENIGSEINVGGKTTFIAGNNINFIDGSQLNGIGDILWKAGNDINIEAGANTHHLDSSNWGASIGFDLQGMGITVGASGGYAKGDGTEYQNAAVNSDGKVTMISGNDTNIIGGNIHGKEIDLDVGHDLNLITLQSDNHYESKQASASITIGADGPTGGSFSYAEANADSKMSYQISSITSDGEMTINVANNTNLVGSVINSEDGDLTLNSKTLTFKDLKDHDHSDSTSVSVSVNSGGGLPASGGFSHSESDFQRTIHATIGQGNLNIQEGGDGGINRDVNQTVVVTKNDSSNMSMTVVLPDLDQLQQEAQKIETGYSVIQIGDTIRLGPITGHTVDKDGKIVADYAIDGDKVFYVPTGKGNITIEAKLNSEGMGQLLAFAGEAISDSPTIEDGALKGIFLSGKTDDNKISKFLSGGQLGSIKTDSSGYADPNGTTYHLYYVVDDHGNYSTLSYYALGKVGVDEDGAFKRDQNGNYIRDTHGDLTQQGKTSLLINNKSLNANEIEYAVLPSYYLAAGSQPGDPVDYVLDNMTIHTIVGDFGPNNKGVGEASVALLQAAGISIKPTPDGPEPGRWSRTKTGKLFWDSSDIWVLVITQPSTAPSSIANLNLPSNIVFPSNGMSNYGGNSFGTRFTAPDKAKK